MSKHTTALFAGLLAATVAVPAFAQTPMPATPPMSTPMPPASPGLPPGTPSTQLPGAVGRPTAATGAFFTTPQATGSWRATELMGVGVRNRAQEKVGDVSDIIVETDGRVVAIVIGVGGFLGMGERQVAVNIASMTMTREQGGRLGLTADLTKTMLQSAPAFTSASR